MAKTPIDQGLGRDSKRPSVRTPDWLLDYVQHFQDDYNNVLTELAEGDEEIDRLKLDSQSDAIRRLLDIGLGAFYAGQVHMFAAPPGLNVCSECAATGEKIRIGIIPVEDGEQDYKPESKLCLECGHEEVLTDDVPEEPDEDAESPFDGVEA